MARTHIIFLIAILLPLPWLHGSLQNTLTVTVGIFYQSFMALSKSVFKSRKRLRSLFKQLAGTPLIDNILNYRIDDTNQADAIERL